MAPPGPREPSYTTGNNSDSQLYTSTDFDRTFVCTTMGEGSTTEECWVGRLVDGDSNSKWTVVNASFKQANDVDFDDCPHSNFPVG
jgi:hypothetical protein